MNKVKIVCLYQVIMHYRLSFYERIHNEPDINFVLVHGYGKKGTKLKNTQSKEFIFETLKLRNYNLGLPFTPSLFFHLIRLNPDVILTEGSSSLINSSIAFIYSILFNKKIIWWSLGTLKNKTKSKFRNLVGRWENIIEKNVDAIFTYSSQGYNYFLKRGVSEKKLYRAVNVFDTDKKFEEINNTFIPNYITKSDLDLCFIGTIEKTKNLELLIDVVFKLNKDFIDRKIVLHVVGDGSHLKLLKEYCEYSNYSSSIVFYGRINNGSSKILKNCDLMVLPGLGGLAIVEGMLNGLPVISGNADGTELDLIDSNNGFVIEDMCFKTLYTILEPFVFDKSSLKLMGDESLKRIRGEYSFNNYFKVFRKMFDELKS